MKTNFFINHKRFLVSLLLVQPQAFVRSAEYITDVRTQRIRDLDIIGLRGLQVNDDKREKIVRTKDRIRECKCECASGRPQRFLDWDKSWSAICFVFAVAPRWAFNIQPKWEVHISVVHVDCLCIHARTPSCHARERAARVEHVPTGNTA